MYVAKGNDFCRILINLIVEVLRSNCEGKGMGSSMTPKLLECPITYFNVLLPLGCSDCEEKALVTLYLETELVSDSSLPPGAPSAPSRARGGCGCCCCCCCLAARGDASLSDTTDEDTPGKGKKPVRRGKSYLGG